MARINERQKRLFDALADAGTLSLAIGPQGITCHLVDVCNVTTTDTEDRLDFGDGTYHVHIDWDRIKKAQIGIFDGRACVSFFDGELLLFRIYKPEGDFSDFVRRNCGTMIYSSEPR
jgi:hypothetical protein